MVKKLPAMQETLIWPLGWEDSLEKEMATHSSIFCLEIPPEEPGGIQSTGSRRVGQDWATNTTFGINQRNIAEWEFADSGPRIVLLALLHSAITMRSTFPSTWAPKWTLWIQNEFNPHQRAKFHQIYTVEQRQSSKPQLYKLNLDTF